MTVEEDKVSWFDCYVSVRQTIPPQIAHIGVQTILAEPIASVITL